MIESSFLGMCMIEAESNFNTKKTAKYPPNAFEWIYTSYGLFQVTFLEYYSIKEFWKTIVLRVYSFGKIPKNEEVFQMF